jgi:hypothetical protein
MEVGKRMNLICPHCQKMVSVPDQSAGQTTVCPYCNQAFKAPTAPPPVSVDLPVDIPLAPEPPPREPARAPEPAPAHTEEGGVYRVAPEPPRPVPVTPRREERPAPTAPRAAQPRPQPEPVTAPPSVPPAGYVHTRTIWISPRVVLWVAPMCFILLFILQFLPATGSFPGGYSAYTQSCFQAIWARYSRDPVAEKVTQQSTRRPAGEEGPQPLSKQLVVYSNWPCMFPYFLVVLAGLVLTLAPRALAAGVFHLPPAWERYWPWRSAILLALAVVALGLLLIQLAAGFGLENAVTTLVSKDYDVNAAQTPQDKDELEIKQGMDLGRYNLRRTDWLSFNLFVNVVVILGILGELWLERRGTRPMPRIELQW